MDGDSAVEQASEGVRGLDARSGDARRWSTRTAEVHSSGGGENGRAKDLPASTSPSSSLSRALSLFSPLSGQLKVKQAQGQRGGILGSRMDKFSPLNSSKIQLKTCTQNLSRNRFRKFRKLDLVKIAKSENS